VVTKRIEYLSLKSKIAIATEVVKEAYERFLRPAIVFNGDKDSTVVLDLVKKYSVSNNVPVLPALFIDHGMHFDETWKFLERAKDVWGIKVIVEKNENALSHVSNGVISVDSLNSKNRNELEQLNYRENSIPVSLHSEVANHLLRTVPMNEAIEKYRFDALLVGLRWDENEAVASEVFISPKNNPFHYRIHPILTFTEKDIWAYILQNNLPKHPLYSKGFRSIDSKEDSVPESSIPAWEQTGRYQDEEEMIERLRNWGYI